MSDYDHENQRLGACEFCRLHIICTELPSGSIKQTTRCRYIQHSTLGREFDSPHLHNNAHPTLTESGGLRFVGSGGNRKTEAAKPSSVCGGRGRVGVASTYVFCGACNLRKLSDL